MKIYLLGLLLCVAGCASDPDNYDDEPGERNREFQVSAGPSTGTVVCPGRNTTCYAEVRRACGDLGVEEVSMMGRSRVVTAGRSGSSDDPFARAERNRRGDESVELRCRQPREPDEDN